jgi:ribosomal protein S18 acetylase RimI-like enzyme
MDHSIPIRRATPDDIDELASLFDSYRQFYAQPSNAELARAFISARLQNNDSVILIAPAEAPLPSRERDWGEGMHDLRGSPPRLLGFTQLYPTLCSVSAAPIYVLYDLFVLPQARRAGVGTALLRAAAHFAATTDTVRLELATAKSNQAAQALYRSLGWVRDDVFDRYSLTIER